MIKSSVVLILSFIFCAGAFAQDVLRESKSSVEFNKIGTYEQEETAYITTEQKRADTKSKFKGKGILGKTLGKAVLQSGETGQIMQPLQDRIVNLNHKKKEYTISPIPKLGSADTGAGETGDEQEEMEPRESNVEIVHSELRVTDEGEDKNINKFPCHKYSILWLMKTRNKATDQISTDSLYTIVWTTAYTDDLREIVEVEKAFSTQQLGALGIDLQSSQYQSLLGLNWVGMLSKLGNKGSSANQSSVEGNEDWVKELEKLEGYPIVVDGEFYHIMPKDAAASDDGSDPTDIQGAVGGFLKNKFGKKKSSGPEATFKYYNEVKKCQLLSAGSKPFTIPDNYEDVSK